MAEEAKTIAAALGRDPVDYVDGEGRTHKLNPLTLGELMEIEGEFWPISEWSSRGSLRASLWAKTLWIALRRESLDRKEVRKRQWAVTFERASAACLLGDAEFEVTDAWGGKIRLAPLSLLDLIEVEKVAGPFSKWADLPLATATLVRILWLAIRKAGRTIDQCAAGDWGADPVKEEEVPELFDLSVSTGTSFSAIFSADKIASVAEVWGRLMGRSGVNMKAKEATDPLARPAGDSGGTGSSAKPSHSA